MERFHRYYRLHRILSSRRLPVPRAALERELECSRASVMRVIEDPRELVMDILKHGPRVEVLAPAALRREVAAQHDAAACRYGATAWTNMS